MLHARRERLSPSHSGFSGEYGTTARAGNVVGASPPCKGRVHAMTSTDQVIKPDFRVYRMDVTEYWNEDIQARAGRLFAVYLFDANRHVHACELTASYEMRYLGPTW